MAQYTRQCVIGCKAWANKAELVADYLAQSEISIFIDGEMIMGKIVKCKLNQENACEGIGVLLTIEVSKEGLKQIDKCRSYKPTKESRLIEAKYRALQFDTAYADWYKKLQSISPTMQMPLTIEQMLRSFLDWAKPNILTSEEMLGNYGNSNG